MELASKVFSSASRFTHVLWLNDDVELFPHAIDSLISLMKSSETDIVVGQTTSKSGMPSYGGFVKRSRFAPLHFDAVLAGEKPVKAETFNGNIVLLGRKALETLGPFLPGYKHYLADIAYGLEATRKGLNILVAPSSLGMCEPNLRQNPARTSSGAEHSSWVANSPAMDVLNSVRRNFWFGLFLCYLCTILLELSFPQQTSFLGKLAKGVPQALLGHRQFRIGRGARVIRESLRSPLEPKASTCSA
jgi:GT2 family glycosyltransferase